MATGFSFPLAPTVDQEVTLPDGGKVKWNGYAWVEVPAASGGGTPISNTTVSDTAPLAPNYGDRWLRPASMTEVVWAPNAGTAGAWVNPAEAGGWDTAAYVKKTGDTMTGLLALDYSSPQLILKKAAGSTENTVYGMTPTGMRWKMSLGDIKAETGSNAGSNFAIERYTDAGVYTGRVFQIHRGTGTVTIGPGTDTAGTVTNTTIAALHLNKAGGSAVSQLRGQNNGIARWALTLGSGIAESGSNVGSDFAIENYTDAGAFMGTPLAISRATGTITIPGTVNAGPGNHAGALTASSLGTGDGAIAGGKGMGFLWDGGTLNYLSMGGGLGASWSWQWNRNTGDLRYLNDQSAPLVTLAANGTIQSHKAGSGDGFYCVAGGYRTDKPAATAFYAPSGGVTVGTTIDAAGRITSSASDVAAIYASSPGGGIYTECTTDAAFRATQGGIQIAKKFTTGNYEGLNVTGYSANPGVYSYQALLLGNPNWAGIYFRSWHQHGAWAGFTMEGGGSPWNSIQFVLSTASGNGEVKAGAFTVISDERGKELVAPLDQQHAAFMGIVPIKWHWPVPPEPKDDDPPMYPDLREQWGFSAQNLSKSVAMAVNGDVNAVDPDGKPIKASVNPVPVLATTVLEVQALWARIEALEARITQLEAA